MRQDGYITSWQRTSQAMLSVDLSEGESKTAYFIITPTKNNQEKIILQSIHQTPTPQPKNKATQGESEKKPKTDPKTPTGTAKIKPQSPPPSNYPPNISYLDIGI